MPKVDTIANTGKEWIIHLLDGCQDEVRLPIIMTLWRNWYVRNKVYHGKPAPSVDASCRFLCGYIDALLHIWQHPSADMEKGKTVISYVGRDRKQKSHEMLLRDKPPERWTPPPLGSVKLNTDGSWLEEESTGGAGMILRDCTGAIIFASCRFIPRCASGLEAEIAAIMEGVSIALDRSTDRLLIETDCMAAARMITSQAPDRSPAAAMVNDIKQLLSSRTHEIKLVGRAQNKASHVLARMGRSLPKTAVWLRCAPEEVETLCQLECNNSV